MHPKRRKAIKELDRLINERGGLSKIAKEFEKVQNEIRILRKESNLWKAKCFALEELAIAWEKCPLCGANLAIKHNRMGGIFVGCTSFGLTNCKYTEQIGKKKEEVSNAYEITTKHEKERKAHHVSQS